MRILCVGGDPVWLGLAKQMLCEVAQNDAKVTAALTGGQALRLLRKADFDLLITDLQLYDMPGLDMIRQAKTVSPRTEIAALRGRSDNVTPRQVYACGASRCLIKPIVSMDLLELIDMVREQAHQHDGRALSGGERNSSFLSASSIVPSE